MDSIEVRLSKPAKLDLLDGSREKNVPENTYFSSCIDDTGGGATCLIFLHQLKVEGTVIVLSSNMKDYCVPHQ
tara:strand:+ start:556 stop:774 length:219 start_codon:yes stop_codon:yes gene_type:complete